jgi:hypothetical protein
MLVFGSGFVHPRQRGGAEPDRRRGWTELRRKPGRAQVAQPAVRPVLIVVAAVMDYEAAALARALKIQIAWLFGQ